MCALYISAFCPTRVAVVCGLTIKERCAVTWRSYMCSSTDSAALFVVARFDFVALYLVIFVKFTLRNRRVSLFRVFRISRLVGPDLPHPPLLLIYSLGVADA